MKKSNIPKEILNRVEDELLSGEQLLWVGLPKSRHVPADRQATSKLTGAILLITMMLGIGMFIFISGAVAYSLLMILVAVSIMIFAIVAAAMRALQSFRGNHQLYAITNRRALILMEDSVQSFSAKDLQFIERTSHRDGTGDIVFREEHYKRVVPTGYTVTQKRERVTTGFYGIENPKEVEALMLETFKDDVPDYRRLRGEQIGDKADYDDDYGDYKEMQHLKP